MEKLPTEVLEIIFEHLSVNDMIACLKVCRKWNGVLSDNSFLLAGKNCVMKGSSKMNNSKQFWKMVGVRKPCSITLRNADPITLQLLLKHNPDLTTLIVECSNKTYKKVLRTLTLFKNLSTIGLYLTNNYGNLVHDFSIQWVHNFPKVRKFILGGVGSIIDDAMLPSSLTHLSFVRHGFIPEIQNAKLYLTHLEIININDTLFELLSLSIHNLHTLILENCNCNKLEFPPTMIRDLKLSGTVTSVIKLDPAIMLDKVHFSLRKPLPECSLPSTVTQLSVRGTAVLNTHWFLALSIACQDLVKLDLRGYTLKDTIASTLCTRFPRLRDLNIIGVVSRNVDHVYLMALLQEGIHLARLFCDEPRTCSLADIKELFPKCFISSFDRSLFAIACNH